MTARVTTRLRVLVYLHIPEADADAVTAAYHQISSEMAGVDGLLGNELLRSPSGDRGAVMSEWTGWEAFSAWEQGASHRDTTAGLRPHQDSTRSPVFDVFEVAAQHVETA